MPRLIRILPLLVVLTALVPMPAGAQGTSPYRPLAAGEGVSSVNLGPAHSVRLPERRSQPPPAPARVHPLLRTRSFANAPASSSPGRPIAPETSVKAAPAAATLFRSTDPGSAIPTKDTVLEPSVSNNQNVVFYTTNWSAAVSTDSGASFSYINPFTDLPSAAAGFCCDQVTIYDPHYDITIWELLYINDANGNVQRLAVANGRAGVANNSWHYWDITAQMFGYPTGDWLDFPRLALSTNYLYLSTNVFTSANSSITTAMFRMPLSALSSPSSTPTGVVVKDPAVDVFEPVSGATDTMYFGAHFSPTDFRVYRWPEAGGSPQMADVTHPAFIYENGDGLCPSPDTFNMCGRSDSRVAAGWLSAGTLGFFWAAKQGIVGTQTFPYPYVQGIRIDAATAAHVDDPQIFSSSYAYQYPEVAANAVGHLGLSIVYGGGTIYPSSAYGIMDDFSPSAFSLLPLRSGDHGPSNNSWGDYLTVRPASGNGLTWVGTSYTLQGGTAGSSVEPRFLWFGRLRDDPFAPSASSHDFSAVVGSSTGSVVTANFTGPSAHAADYTATIDWGDGSATGPGTVAGTGQAFNVTGSHTYSTAGSFTVTTAVSDAFASTSTVKSAATVTATQAANDVKVSANPASISADGASTSTVKAIVTKHVGSTPVAGDTVNFALSGAACGSLGAPSATTNASGNASVTYTSSTTTGLCTVTATETSAGGSGGTIITETRAGGTYHPLAPFRILDTRPGSQIGPYSSPFGPDAAREVQVGGFPGSPYVPTSGVSAVVLNVTVTNTTAPSYLTIYPDGAARPFASNLNWAGGATIPNLVEVAVGLSSTSAPGYISVYNQRGNADVVIDVQGFVTDPASSPGPDGLFNSVAPARILDTRTGVGAPIGKLGPNSTLSLTATGSGGVQSSGVEAVVLNVTVTNPTAPSFLTVWPEGSGRPTASNLNFLPNQTIPNRVIVPVGPGGKVSIYNQQGSVDVVADVGGWYTDTTAGGTGLRFQAVTPYRILDTRPTPIQADSSIPVQVTGTIGAGTTPSSAHAVVINVTTTDTSAGSYLTVWPDGTAKPPSSDLNWPPGVTIANLVVIKLGSGGKVDAYNQLGTTNVVVDLVGFYI